MAKSLSVSQALSIRRSTLRLEGGWGDCVGEIDRTGVVFFWGKSGNGKTSAVLSFGKELARFDLNEEASTNTALIFGEIYRHGNEWKFRAVGQGYNGGLGPLAKNYGVNV